MLSKQSNQKHGHDNDDAEFVMRLMRKFSLGQVRVYWCKATDSQKLNFKTIGYPEVTFNPKKPIGHNTIRNMHKDFARRIGIKDSQNLALIRIVSYFAQSWRMI